MAELFRMKFRIIFYKIKLNVLKIKIHFKQIHKKVGDMVAKILHQFFPKKTWI